MLVAEPTKLQSRIDLFAELSMYSNLAKQLLAERIHCLQHSGLLAEPYRHLGPPAFSWPSGRQRHLFGCVRASYGPIEPIHSLSGPCGPTGPTVMNLGRVETDPATHGHARYSAERPRAARLGQTWPWPSARVGQTPNRVGQPTLEAISSARRTCCLSQIP